MRTKKVNRYFCDFCGKGGQAASHLSRHEKSCTLNPNRVCRVCKMSHGKFGRNEAVQVPVASLVQLLPRASKEAWEKVNVFILDDTDPLLIALQSAVKDVREKSGNCPACIMAALRQANIPVPLAIEFNFTNEMKAIWDCINDEAHEADMRACHCG